MERRPLAFGKESNRQTTSSTEKTGELKLNGYHYPSMAVPLRQEVNLEFFKTPFTSGFC